MMGRNLIIAPLQMNMSQQQSKLGRAQKDAVLIVAVQHFCAKLYPLKSRHKLIPAGKLGSQQIFAKYKRKKSIVLFATN
jgi:hypothetical protein